MCSSAIRAGVIPRAPLSCNTLVLKKNRHAFKRAHGQAHAHTHAHARARTHSSARMVRHTHTRGRTREHARLQQTVTQNHTHTHTTTITNQPKQNVAARPIPTASPNKVLTRPTRVRSLSGPVAALIAVT